MFFLWGCCFIDVVVNVAAGAAALLQLLVLLMMLPLVHKAVIAAGFVVRGLLC